MDLLEFLMKGNRQFNLTTNDINNMIITIDKMEYKMEMSKSSYGGVERDTYYLTLRCERLNPGEIHNEWTDPTSKNNLIEIKDKIIDSYKKQ